MESQKFTWILVFFLFLSQSRLLDRDALKIQVVYNPNSLNTYGISLETDLKVPIRIEKITLGEAVRTYGWGCTTPRQYRGTTSYEHCVINNTPNHYLIEHYPSSKLRLNCKTVSPICVVYYHIAGISRLNYTQKVDTTDCVITHTETPGIPMPSNTPEPAGCIWAIGHIIGE